MPNFTFKVGTLDLSEFVRVGEDSAAGLFDQDVLQPSFADSPLAEGGVLSVVDVGLHEKAIPLFLNDSTPALLRTLVRDVNRELRKDGTIRVEWKPPPGTGDSSFYDLAYGRWEPQHNMRHEAKGWLAGILRLWLSPHAHTATERIIATGVASGIVAHITVPSALSGDVDALLDARVKIGSYPDRDGFVVGIAALPHPSYVPWVPAASLITASVFTVNPTNVVGSLAIQDNTAGSIALLLPIPTVYGGRHRILSLVRVNDTRFTIAMPEAGGATQQASGIGHAWHLVDLGVVSVPTSPPPPTVAFPITVAAGSNMWDEETTNDASPDIAGVVVLPAENAAIVVDTARSQVGLDRFPYSASGQALAIDEHGNQYLTPTSFATIGFVNRGGIARAASWGANNAKRMAVLGKEYGDGSVEMVSEIPTHHSMIACGKYTTEDRLLGVFVNGKTTNGSAMIEIARHLTTGATTILATLGLVHSNLDHAFEFVTRGKRWYANVRRRTTNANVTVDYGGGATSMLIASIGGSHADVSARGYPALWQQATAAGDGYIDVEAWRSTETPSQSLESRSIYHFSAVDGAIYRANASDALVERIDARAHGAVPMVKAPSAGGFAAIVAPIHGGRGDDRIDVDIRVRERYEFSNL